MATRFANIKGIVDEDGPTGPADGGTAIVTFDLAGTAYTGGADTVQIGGGGTDGGAATSSTLAVIMQNRRRDGKAVTILSVAPAPNFASGNQSVATNGPKIFAQTAAVSGGNVTALTLFSAASGGSAITTTTAGWERALAIKVHYNAV